MGQLILAVFAFSMLVGTIGSIFTNDPDRVVGTGLLVLLGLVFICGVIKDAWTARLNRRS
jgi:putative Mn2+ efflux pump MntP